MTSRDEEFEVLTSIYAENVLVWCNSSGIDCVTYRHENIFVLTFIVPVDYPEVSLPEFELKLVNGTTLKQSQINHELSLFLEENRGCEILFQAIEYVKDKALEFSSSADLCCHENILDSPLENIEHEALENFYQSEEMYEYEYESKFAAALDDSTHSSFPPRPNFLPLNIIHGEVSMEKKSSFQSHLCAVTSMSQVTRFRDSIITDKRFSHATHNIFVYRFTCPTTGIVYHDYDDDGEDAAGGRVAEMVRLMSVTGVAMVISRWFGGIKLGPDRFKFINNSARTLLENNGWEQGGGGGKKEGIKDSSSKHSSRGKRR